MRLRGVIRLATGAALAAALLTGCSDNTPGQPTPRTDSGHGKEFPATSTEHIAIAKGERFSLVVDENASVGDGWEVKTPPDAKIARPEGDDYVSTSPSGSVGGGGKRYFMFTALEPGNTSIELYNCFRGCTSERDKAESKGHTVRLTVS